ncbi:biotin synthase BioB [Deltaproteobacteria bacterium OttesenSCG-928-K17]|nr:biotin synthase BioB [Deltaproteobacteria bacterium OttesenSCG-928-K17]
MGKQTILNETGLGGLNIPLEIRDKLTQTNPLDLMALARFSAARAEVRPFTCAIINIKSGRCGEDCAFCAQSAHYNTGLANYPMLETDEVLRRAEKAAQWGCRYLGLVASGADLGEKDFARLLKMGEALKKCGPNLCASIGSLSPDRAAALKSAGFTSCHHNLEAGPNFFKRICGTHDLASRIATVKTARRAGLRTCCGGIFGLGESWRDRLELADLLNELEVDSIPINFLMPIHGTPLGGRPMLSPAEALRLIALMRLTNPGRDIVICGGREKTLGTLKNMCFSAGANGLMIGDYLTAKGSPPESDLAELAALELI